MLTDKVIDPYTNKEMQHGGSVICRTTSVGVTFCRVKYEGKKYAWSILAAVMVIFLILFVFSVRLDITIKNRTAITTQPSEALYQTMLFLPLISIFVGTLLAFLFVSKIRRRS